MTRGKPIEGRQTPLSTISARRRKSTSTRAHAPSVRCSRELLVGGDAVIAAVSPWVCVSVPRALRGRISSCPPVALLLFLRPKMSGTHRPSSQDDSPAAAAAGAGAPVNASSDPQSAHMVASPSLSVSSTPLHVLAHASTQERKRSVSACAEQRPAKRKIVKVTRACDICKV